MIIPRLMDFHEVRLRLGGIRVGHEFASPDHEEKCYTKRGQPPAFL